MNSDKVDKIAKVCHEINRVVCQSFGQSVPEDWASSPEWQRNSIRLGVQFSLENPEAPPSANHESWLRQKTAEGWSYGSIKDVNAKTHPYFLPYDQLPPEQRVKDLLFKTLVQTLNEVL